MSRSCHTTRAIATGKTALQFVVLVLLLGLSACGRTASTVIQNPLTNGPFSNIPVGTGNNPEPGNTSQPEPSPTGHRESIVAGNAVAYVGSDIDRLYALNAGSGAVEWQQRLGGPVTVFAVSGDVVYAGGDGVYALSAATGQVLWQFHHSGDGEFFVAIGSGMVIASTNARGNHFTLYGLQGATGNLVWQYTMASFFPGLLGVVNKVVYTAEASASASTLTAQYASSGRVLWQQAVQTGDGVIAGPPVESNGILYFETSTGAVYALQPATGSVLWHVSVSSSGGPPLPAGPDLLSPMVDNGLVYSGSESGVSAYRASDGTQVWHYRQVEFGPFIPEPVLVSGMLYVSINGLVVALNPSRGTVLWQNPGKGPVTGPLLFGDGVVIGGTLALYGLQANDGSQLWKSQLPQEGSRMGGGAAGPEALGSGPAGDAIVYIGAESGVVNALRASTGKQLWQFAIPEPLVPAAPIYSADITFKPGTSFTQALLTVTDLGLKTFWGCTAYWTNLTGRWSQFSSLDLTVNATVASAPLWYERLQALPEVTSLYPNPTWHCPEEILNLAAPQFLPSQQAGTYVEVTFSSGTAYASALEGIDGLGFRLATPCYEQARARGDKPTWQSMSQAGTFTQSHSLILATTPENATIWLQQLHALSGMQKVNDSYTTSC